MPLAKVRRLYRSGTLGLAVKGEIGGWVSTFGERIGSERLVYNAWTYAGFHRTALETGPVMVAAILELFPGVHRAVDFGCGTGVYVHELRKRGLSAEGYEYGERARGVARDALGLALHAFDLDTFDATGLGFDLALSFEVAEHLPPALGDRLVEVCGQAAPCVVFSAAHPGQPGQGHINSQPRSYWIDRFERRGHRFEAQKTARLEAYLRQHLVRGFWLADNVGVYESQRPTAIR